MDNTNNTELITEARAHVEYRAHVLPPRLALSDAAAPVSLEAAHDGACEADWGLEGQESPCRCGARSLEAVKAETTDERCDQCTAPDMSFEQARGLGRGLALCTAHWNRWVVRWINSDDEPGVSAHLIQGVIHAAPSGDSGVMPCCGRTPFELSPTQRMTLDPESVTCIPGAPVSTEGDAK